ncbi:MAG: efflux RND transporter periplasmic adaptor subunit [Puniceicoccales bacterium]|jgi:multidrug efflux system membrane fusion protein|nr:efflux RND transporter periplasmic adaptor subunit [Puniceicoccales bacterium]
MKYRFSPVRWGFIGLLGLGLTSCRDSGPDSMAPTQRPPTPVHSVLTQERDVPLYLEALGHLRASEEVQIIPQVSGEIVAVHFKQGSVVQKGELLFSLDDRLYAAAVEKAKAELAKARSQLKIDEAQYERSKPLVPESYISSQEFELRAARVEQSQAHMQLAQSQLDAALVNLEHCSLRAPITGLAGKYELDAGNVVAAGSGKMLLSLKKLDPLYVDFSISENQFPQLQQYFDAQKGTKVVLQSLSEPSRTAEGSLRFLSNAIDPSTGNLQLRAEVANPSRTLWPGESVSVQLILKTLKKAVLLPETCVKLGQQGHYLFVIKPDRTVELRPVQKGQKQGDLIAITQGVSAGEEVVAQGQMLLAPGASVAVLPKQ